MPEAGRRERAVVAAVYLAFLVMHAVLVWERAAVWPFPNQTDELEHLSLAWHLKEQPALFPDYQTVRVLDWPGGGWSGRGNYVNHPAPYYLALGLVLPEDRAQGVGWLAARRLNAGLSVLAVAAAFWFGFRRLSGLRRHAVFALGVALCPLVGGLGGQINNDNLALLGGAVLLAGLGGLMPASAAAGPGRALVSGLGFVLGAWAKLTAGLLLGLWVVLLHAWLARDGTLPRSRGYWAVLASAIVLGAAPYLHGLAVYGAPLWDNAHLFAREGPRMTGLAEYLGWFAHGLGASWVVDQPGDWLQIATLLALLGLAAGAGWAARGRGVAGLGLWALVAALVVLPVHFAYSWQVHLAVGHLGGPDFRYYLPLWPAVAAGVAAALGPGPGERWRLAGTAAVFGLLLYTAVLAPGSVG